ncbi:MAG: ROK family transcriptional regulator [Desulfobacteraceae bacterium]|jgi:predicted NBD/HSP70 family sugar kinase
MPKKGKASLSIRSFQRAMHRSKFLELIRTSELISRTDLAKATGLSQASVTGITADLIEEGLIEEKQAGAYEGGRPPILLAIRPNGVHVIGVNLTIASIRIVIINFRAELKASYTIPTGNDYYSPEEIIEKIAQGIQACMWEANFSKDQIAGVGVGLPGPVDSVSGIVKFLPNYGWEEIAFRKMLHDRINHPIFVDNSSNNLATAEYWYGSGKGVDNFFVITVENGVGAGIILNGQLVRGHLGIASEFGHTCADINGPLCRCGRRGCIEAYAGNNSIIRDAKELATKGKWVSSKISPEKICYEDVITELSHNNKALEKIYNKAGNILGIGVHNLITLLNPKIVIITGKGVKAGDFLFSPMFRAIKKLKSGRFNYSQTKIHIKQWDDGDWARGAGTLVLREIYKSPAMK